VEQVQDIPQHRYGAELAGELERTWQETWARLGTFHVPNPVGSLAPQDGSAVPADKMFVLDMFPYPSGEGLHVGHPLGYIATDVYARYFRMTGRNVLHALGFDAFGLPAEQYAVQTGTHPRTRTEANIVNFRRQLGRLGLGHDARRSFSTTDVDFYKSTSVDLPADLSGLVRPGRQQGQAHRRVDRRVRFGCKDAGGRAGVGAAVGG
jgi:leucyl-tRNA synthetase